MSKKKVNTETTITRADLRAAVSPVSVSSPLAGLVDASTFQMPTGATIKSMSPMVRPVDFPEGKVLVGKLAKLFETNPAKGKKSVGIEIIPAGAQVGIALPAVATIAQGLEITDTELGSKARCPYVGRTVAIQKMPGKLKSKKGQDGWHFIVAIYPEAAAV